MAQRRAVSQADFQQPRTARRAVPTLKPRAEHRPPDPASRRPRGGADGGGAGVGGSAPGPPGRTRPPRRTPHGLGVAARSVPGPVLADGLRLPAARAGLGASTRLEGRALRFDPPAAPDSGGGAHPDPLTAAADRGGAALPRAPAGTLPARPLGLPLARRGTRTPGRGGPGVPAGLRRVRPGDDVERQDVERRALRRAGRRHGAGRVAAAGGPSPRRSRAGCPRAGGGAGPTRAVRGFAGPPAAAARPGRFRAGSGSPSRSPPC